MGHHNYILGIYAVTDTTSGGGAASTDTYATAIEYVNAGLFVFPVTVTRDAAGKKTVRPHGEWRKGSSDRLTDVERWWGPDGIHRSAGILIDTGKSGLVVVDPDGQEGVANWVALNPPLPLWIARTPGGGEHWYYREHPDHPIGNDQSGKVAPHVDVRGLGGFVIAPPTHDGTGSWEWMADPNWVGDAVVPGLVIERMTKRIPDAPPATYAYIPNKGSEQAFEDDLFDDVKHERRFTKQQATEFVRAARKTLAGTTQGFNGAINNFAMACAHFPWLVDRDLCARLMIKTLGPVTGWTAPDRQDEATINSAYSATEAGKSWVAVEVAETSTSTATGGSEGDDTGRKLLIHSAAEMAYWLQENAGTGLMSGFFLRNGEVVHTPRVSEAGYVPPPDGGKNGPAEIRPLTAGVLAAKLQYLYECYKVVDVKDDAGKKTGEKAEVPALFPVEAARRAVDAPEALSGLRPLAGLTGTPMVRADGSLLAEAGYDQASGFLFLPEFGVSVPAVPEHPDAEEIASARKLLLHMISDFPFATDDDRANYLGLLLTPLLRQVAPSSYKLFGIGAHQPGSGKSLLAEIAGDIHGMVLRSELPEDEAEWRKMTFSILGATAAPLVVLDNITGVLRSSTLAGILTAGREITDRELGKNTSNITVANDRVWVVTGNNLSLGGDLVRRTITILIDPDRPNPEKRTDFTIPDLRTWVAENRNEILHALLTLIRAWVSQGMPEPMRAQSDSFARWERVVAGVLEVAGIGGAFDAESGKRAAAGGDDDGLATVLDVLYARFGDRIWYLAEALEPKTEDGFLIEQRDWLPTPVLDKLGRSEASGRKAFGWWLRNRVGRWVTTVDGRPLVLREAGRDRKGAIWKVESR